MASVIKFTATKLDGTGKKGLIKPDADGYYELVIGALNTMNSAGEYYVLNGAKELFEQSSIFMRRVKNGCLKSECGHPKMQPSMKTKDYLSRILSIEETNVCCHIKDVWLDLDYGKRMFGSKNPNLVAIVAKLKPTGPRGPALQAALDNPHENVCFSIRALTRDYYERDQCYRVLTTIVTFDWVTEPGISVATKYSSPSLESLAENIITRAQLTAVVNDQRLGFATEDSKALAQECLVIIDKTPTSLPAFAKW